MFSGAGHKYIKKLAEIMNSKFGEIFQKHFWTMTTFLAEKVHVEDNENNASALRSTHHWFCYYEELWFYLNNLCHNIWMSINLFAKHSPDLLIFSIKCCNVITDTAKRFSFSPFVTLHYFLWQAFASRIDFSKCRSYSAFKVQAEYVIHAATAILYFDEIFKSKQQSCT